MTPYGYSGAQYLGPTQAAAPEPPRASLEERVVAALYRLSPAGIGVLSAELEADSTEALGRLLRDGRVVSRQVGDVYVYALKGCIG